MSQASSGKLLVSLLLMFCSARIFFIKREKIDTLSSLSVVAVAVSAAQIVFMSADCVSLALFVVAVFSFITNIHALSRLREKLVVDHYNALFIVFSLISLLCSLFLFALIIYFADTTVTPARMRKMGITLETLRYNGNFADGFAKCKPFEKSNALIQIYSPVRSTEIGTEISKDDDMAATVSEQHTRCNRTPVVILATDKRAGIAGYQTYMALLAAKGYTVVTGEFSEGRWLDAVWMPQFGAVSFRRLVMVLSWLFDKAEFEKQHEFYTFAVIKEIQALLDIAAALYGDGARCLVSDQMSSVAVKTASNWATNAGGKDISTFDLTEVLTSPGLGFVQQADPLLAWMLHLPRVRTLDDAQKAVEYTVSIMKQKMTEDKNDSQ